jgi:rRNA processing protein Gar1
VEVAEMIARDAGWTPKPGLEVFDKDGQKVG